MIEPGVLEVRSVYAGHTEGEKISRNRSAGRGEGRSWLAANLAGFRTNGEEVLLIDADFATHATRAFKPEITLWGVRVANRTRGPGDSGPHSSKIAIICVACGALAPNPQDCLVAGV